MLHAVIDWDICKECDPCSAILICKVRAIVQIDPGDSAVIDQTRCNGCGDCLPACPFSAISLGGINGANIPDNQRY